MIQHVHWNGINHSNFSMVVFEDKNHIKIFQVKLDSFKVNKFNIFQCNDKWRLQFKIN